MTLAKELFATVPRTDTLIRITWRGMLLSASFGNVPGLWEISATVAGEVAYFYGSTPEDAAKHTEAFFDVIGKTT